MCGSVGRKDQDVMLFHFHGKCEVSLGRLKAVPSHLENIPLAISVTAIP